MNFLFLLGKLYGRVMDVRNRLYDRGTFRSHDLGARTISVGNLTAGGTGKTPLVALIAKLLLDEGETVCILTRGYGRVNPKSRVLVSDGKTILVDAATGGDEPLELAMKLDGKAIIVADPDRVAAAKWARDNFPITTFILDDGFQHRRAKRDLDIVCIDATSPCGNGRILPAGTLRESFKGLNRADVIVITRSELAYDLNALKDRLRRHNPDAPIVDCSTGLRGFSALDDFFAGHSHGIRSESSPERFLAFTGIGNPDSFFQNLERWNVNVVGTKAFADHQRYDNETMKEIEKQSAKAQAKLLITTSKDAVKLSGLITPLPCFVALTKTVIDDEKDFRGLILS